jgi:hypothetical protein
MWVLILGRELLKEYCIFDAETHGLHEAILQKAYINACILHSYRCPASDWTVSCIGSGEYGVLPQLHPISLFINLTLRPHHLLRSKSPSGIFLHRPTTAQEMEKSQIMTSAKTAYPPFPPVDTSNRPQKDEVESPSISSTNALARFEFEAGHGREGTKILMVEWEDDESTRGVRGEWHISWDGKGTNTVLPAEDQPSNDVNRIYFMLAPGVAVPGSITLTHRPQDSDRKTVVWHTNPLPAIFPPELGASARAAGKKGILHTIWAKKRLQVLQREIQAESKNNVDGIGLLMVVQEKEWIEQTFGVNAKPAGLSLSLTEPTVAPPGPASPRSPGGGRLMEKLRGLKLGTSEKELSQKPEGNDMPFSNPLSPESSDVAVSSFAAFKGANPMTLAAKPPQNPQPIQQQAPRKIATAVPPPAFVAQQQQQGPGSGLASLNAITESSPSGIGGLPPPFFQSRGVPMPDDDKDDGLFALPISPRSPEMGKSPFSFATGETAKYTA